MTKSYTLIRKVLIRPKELTILKKHCLVKSPYGNKALYDTCDWRPINRDDFLVEMLRGTVKNDRDIHRWVRSQWQSFYDRRYSDWNYEFFKDELIIYPDNQASFEPFGWAKLSKTFDK